MKTKAQSTVEYSLIFAAVTVAVIGMFLYTKRAVNANLKNVQEGLNAAITEESGGPGGPGGPDKPDKPDKPLRI